MTALSSAKRVSRWAWLAFAAIGFGASPAAFAWIYPEHRDIAVLAVQGLDAERRAVFDRLWQDTRAGDEQRLCAVGADAAQGVAPACIDWAALPGIAGDHSCSSAEMLETVRHSDWILVVADVAAQLKEDLARVPVTAWPGQGVWGAGFFVEPGRRLADEASRAKRVNALRAADTRLQRADPQYATRADSNLAHFLMPRPDTNLDPIAYGLLTLKPGSELNALGVYVWFHISALQKASRLANEQLSVEQRRALARAMLFDEAFALHFLEDAYASGHVAGSWGDVSQRKGTHDFYNQNGIEVFTWQGRERTIVLMGDAHMRPEDAVLAAKAVRTSIEQVLDTATGRSRGYSVPYDPQAPAAADAFDVCKNATFPDRGLAVGSGGKSPYGPALLEALLDTPVPGLGPGLGSLPRARSEVGPFLGLAASLDGRGINRGFLDGQSSSGGMLGVDVGFRAGLGLEGALGDAGDGLVYLQVGLRADSPSSNEFADGSGVKSGALTAAIPSRSALSTRIRMPYYLVPGDLLLLAPLYWANPEAYTAIAVTASNGGLLGWQQGWATRYGRFQFVLGRELGVNFYGLNSQQQVVAPTGDPGSPVHLVNLKSIAFDLPIVEYRPYRSFSSNQSSSLLFQLFVGADVPRSASFADTGESVDLNTIWFLGLRMVFDWRHYR
jgi:hypothetical protein